MAHKRMFSMDVVDSDAFLEMPPSAQALYFHLNMRADDDGFVGNPRRIIRTVGAAEDDLKLLMVKRFVLTFEDGVLVIKHWRIHNTIKNDRYHPTLYGEHIKRLAVKENKAYTDVVPDVLQIGSKLETEDRIDIGKDRIGKKSNTSAGADLFDLFWKAYPRKVGKPVAHKAYLKAVKKAQHEVLMRGLEIWSVSEDWTHDDGKFIPHASTWLNQERWNDEPRKAKSKGVDRFTEDKPF